MRRHLMMMSVFISAIPAYANPEPVAPEAIAPDPLTVSQHQMDVGMPELALDYSEIVYQVYFLQINAWIVAIGAMVLLFLGLKLTQKTTLDPSILSTLVFVSLGLALTVLRLTLS